MTALVTWLWQGLALVALVAVALRCLRNINATTRHAIWWTTLAGVVVLPWLPQSLLPGVATPDWATVAAANTTPRSLPLAPRVPWLEATVVSAWVGFALWRLQQLASSLRAIATWKRLSKPFEAAHEGRLPLWQASRRSGRHCELRMSDAADAACALGFRHPVILIPRSLAQALTDDALDLVIAHERAHLLRYDDWLRLLQGCVEAALALHPAAWLIGRRIDLLREAACDDHVVALAGQPRAYADCLVRIAASRVAGGTGARALAPAVVSGTSHLRRRVARLLARDCNRDTHVRRGTVVASILSMTLLALVLARVPPLVTFVDAADVERLEVPRAPLVATATVLTLTGFAAEPAVPPPAQVVPAPRRAQIDGVPEPHVPEPAVAGPAPVDVIASSQPATVVAPAPPSLPSSAPVAQLTVAHAPVTAPTPPPSADAQGPWSAFGHDVGQAGVSVARGSQDVGVTVARGARKAGLAVGRWFARAGGGPATPTP